MSPRPIDIGPAVLTDLEDVHDLFVAYRRFYRLPDAPGVSRRFVQERLARQDSVILLAREPEVHDGACGFAQIYQTFSSLRLTPAWVLNDLFVRPSHRGRGLGRRLVETALTLARSHGVQLFSLETDVANAPARALYSAVGFRESEFLHYEIDIGTRGTTGAADGH